MKRELRGQVVVLTGASRGLGAAIARSLASEGAHMVLAARDAEKLARTGAEIRAAGGQATHVPCDITRAADRQRLIDAAQEVGSIAVLINNAGIETPVALVDNSPSDVDQTVAVNLVAPIHLTKLVLPGMLARRDGVVVMVSSMSGKSPTPYNAIYAATKFGLNGFAASLRIELHGTGVHVGTTCPSFIAGAGMWADLGLKAKRAVREVPIGRVVNSVRQVIDGAPEVLVSTMPARPLLALNQLWPKLDGLFLRHAGVIDVLLERAALIKRICSAKDARDAPD